MTILIRVDLLAWGERWRLVPHDFPGWPTVYWYFGKWRIDGSWGTAHILLAGDAEANEEGFMANFPELRFRFTVSFGSSRSLCQTLRVVRIGEPEWSKSSPE